MQIEVLFFDGCPGHEALVPRLRELLLDLDLEADDIVFRRVDSVAAAERERFLGSPTVRVDGVDIDPDAAGRTDFGLKCRLYVTDEGRVGLPPDDLIVAALRSSRG